MTERSLTENFEKLFGYRCDVLAKIMYIKLSKRKDCAKINLIRFYEVFKNLLDEVKSKRNNTVFELLEFNGDGVLDIMYLMQLFCNLKRNTVFGQEILKIVKEFKNKNVLMTGGFSR